MLGCVRKWHVVITDCLELGTQFFGIYERHHGPRLTYEVLKRVIEMYIVLVVVLSPLVLVLNLLFSKYLKYVTWKQVLYIQR